MTTYLDNNIIVSDIALAYFDKETETLKDLNEGFYCTLQPFSNSFYTLYLIGDMLYTNDISLSFSLTSKDTDKVYIKAYQGEFNYNLFDESTNNLVVKYADSSFKYTNALPIHIRLTSDAVIQSTASLNIKIEVGD